MNPVSSRVTYPSNSRIPLIVVLLLGLSIVLGAREADAQTGDNEIALTVEPDFIVATGDDAAYGAGVQGIVSWGFHPLWNLFGLVDYGHLFVPDEDGSDQNLSSLMAGVGVNLDVVTLVPWGRIGIGGRYDSRLKVLDGAPLDAAVMLEVGLDYRKRRNWAVGFSIQARSAFRPDFRPVDRVRVGLRFSWIRETDRIRY